MVKLLKGRIINNNQNSPQVVENRRNTIMHFFTIILATGFGLGFLPIAPATFACIISILLWYFLLPYHRLVYIFLMIILFIIGILLSNRLIKEWGKDPHRIVIDEYATFLLPLFFTPPLIIPLLFAFLSFRILDIIKPPPIKELEKLPGGLGIMLDDLCAGVYTMVVVLLFNYLRMKI